MKYKIVISLIIVLFSCQYELEVLEPPNDLIPQDSMELILGEMMMVESYVKVKHVNVNSYYEIMRKSGGKLLKKHNIDSARYYKSFDYYAKNQELLSEMYSNIEKKLDLDTLILN